MMASTLTWQMVQAEALRRIRARDWAPGARIPDEEDLARELGCARATVNRALRELAAAGLLERRRKGGTRVPLTPVRKATFEIAIIRHDIEARGLSAGYRLLSRHLAPAPPEIAVRTGNGDLLHIRALHLADGKPFCLETRWIAIANAPGVQEADFATLSANEWLVRNIAFVGGEIAFGAEAAPPQVAALLGCPEGSAVFEITRETISPGGPITSAVLTYAPGYRMRTLI
jgi:GntR family histidine utilization transcriptional repressor